MCDRPLNIAHRGGADLWPENSLAAFRGAIAGGADGAELDVHLSRDGEVVVFHDEALKPDIVRGADGAWVSPPTALLKDLTYAEMQAFDIGRLKPGTGYAARHPEQAAADGERIPRLSDVIALAQAMSERFTLWIELKTDLMRPERGADPLALADAALAVVRRTGFEARSVFVSFDWRTLARVKEKAPAIPVYATTLPQSYFGAGEPPAEDGPPPPRALADLRAAVEAGAPWLMGWKPGDHPSLQHAVKALGADGWFPFYRDLTDETAGRAGSLGLKTAAWTAPEPAYRELLSLGVGAICTDNPLRLRQFVTV
jgi:glycerophosphoryl diester phosphodiesterase